MSRSYQLLACAALLFMVVGCRGGGEPEPQPTPVPGMGTTPVVVEEIFPSPLQQTIQTAGTIEPMAQSTLYAGIEGQVIGIPQGANSAVRRGDLLVEIDSPALRLEIERAESDIQNMESEVKEAERVHDEKKALHARYAIPWSELRQAEIALEASTATLDSARAALDTLLVAFDETKISSPIAGTITRMQVEVGDSVSRGQSLCTVSDMSRIRMKLDVPGRDAASLDKDQEVTIRTDARPGAEFSAHVANIASAPDPQPGNVLVTVVVDNPRGRLSTGRTGPVRILGRKVRDALAVPSDAVVERNGREVVYIADGDTAVERPVRLGISDGKRIEVLEGVAEWDYVVISGQEDLEPGTALSLPEP